MIPGGREKIATQFTHGCATTWSSRVCNVVAWLRGVGPTGW